MRGINQEFFHAATSAGAVGTNYRSIPTLINDTGIYASFVTYIEIKNYTYQFSLVK